MIAGAAIVLVVLLGPAAGTALAIVDGQDTDIEAAPWMVALGRSGDASAPSGYFCGGALVAPTKVVTAAHCIDDEDLGEYQAIGGRADLRGTDGEVRRVVRQWSASRLPPPPGEPRVTPGGDLAVLTLDAPLPFPVLPLTEPGTDADTPGTPASILGWGVYAEEGLPGPSPMLQSGQTRIIELAECDRAFAAHPAVPGRLDPRYFTCTGNIGGPGPSACGGDSGSPLVVNGRLAGVFGPIVSRNGFVCRDAYSGYTRTDVYYDELVREIERV